MSDVKITERGWAGHFCAAGLCGFRRNTLIEAGQKRVVVSTVGNLRDDGKTREVGVGRYYETMAFHAKKEGVYWEADVYREFPFYSDWQISVISEDTEIAKSYVEKNILADRNARRSVR